MRRRNIHSVIVTQPNSSEYGIMTTTDIRDKIIAVDRNPAETRIKEIMTAPVVSASPEWTLKQCSITMQKHGIHHMPVADEQGNFVGLISVTDIFRAAEEIGWGAREQESEMHPARRKGISNGETRIFRSILSNGDDPPG